MYKLSFGSTLSSSSPTAAPSSETSGSPSLPTAPPNSVGGQGLLEYVVAGFKKRDAQIAGLSSCLAETQAKVAKLDESDKKGRILLNICLENLHLI